MTVTAASRHHHGLERSTVTTKTTKVLIPLKASRPVPKCLTLKRMQGQMQYVYNSSRINRRTKRTVPGTGVPCGALSCSEEDDLKSFLEVVERMDDSLAILLRKTFFASPSRIFRHAVAGMTFTVGEPPRLHFNSEKDGILLETEDFITQERLNGIVSTFSWDSDHTIFPGTLHRLTRHSRGHAVANSLTLRLGRQLPDQECRRVAGDLCHRLGEHENLIITGPSGSGKTTLLRAMMNTLMGEFHKRKVGVVDETGELKCTSAFSVDMQQGQDALALILESIQSDLLDVLIVDTRKSLLNHEELSKIREKGVSIVMATWTENDFSTDESLSRWKVCFSLALQVSFVLPKYRLVEL